MEAAVTETEELLILLAVEATAELVRVEVAAAVLAAGAVEQIAETVGE